VLVKFTLPSRGVFANAFVQPGFPRKACMGSYQICHGWLPCGISTGILSVIHGDSYVAFETQMHRTRSPWLPSGSSEIASSGRHGFAYVRSTLANANADPALTRFGKALHSPSGG
jgi:hypothetical protein